MRKSPDKVYMDRVAKLPCVVCGVNSECLHHVREGQGMAQRAQNWLVVPLCNDCHTGNKNGFHGQWAMWKIHKMDELDALAKTIEWLQS